jgi:hypothetical protein
VHRQKASATFAPMSGVPDPAGASVNPGRPVWPPRCAPCG